jgi:hypothetical protein
MIKRSRRTSSRSSLTGICLAMSLASLVAAVPAGAVTITIADTDSAGEGFNDPTPATPVGGNPGTTLGAQRLHLFQYAADVWSMRLGGDVEVLVSASFENLGGTSVSAVLGSAAPSTVHYNFNGRPLSNTWYVVALANQFFGDDLNDLKPQDCPYPLVGGRCPEIDAQFNSAVDNQTVLGATDFYYGLDGKRGSDIDFLSVVLHEIGHGLGVLDLLDGATGDLFQDLPDAYSIWLEDPTITPKDLTSMSELQRKNAMRDTGDLVWVGPTVKAESGGLTGGRRGDGAVEIYAPATYQPGSSVAHYSTSVSPDELMEPFAVAAYRDLDLTLAMLDDIGWQTFPTGDCGDANDDGKVTAADALFALKVAVGSLECSDLVCDVNFSGGVNSADALVLLKSAVGQTISLVCPLI